MPVKIKIEDQIKAMEAVIAAEDLRQMAAVARGEVTKEQAADLMAPVRAALGTLEYIRMNRKDFIDFMKAQEVQAR